MLIVLGEPYLGQEKKNLPPAPMITPVGQLDTMLQLWKQNLSDADIVEHLREEYLAILHAMQVRMQLDMRVVYVDKHGIDQGMLSAAVNVLGCRLLGISPGVDRELTTFPCDFGIELPGISLLSRRYAESVSSVTKGQRTAVSPYGEGGRVLHACQSVAVTEWIINGGSRESADLSLFKSVGLRAGVLPPFLSGEVEGETIKTFANDHLDRIGQMIEGRDGNPHLIMDCLYWSGRAKAQRKPDETHEIVKRVCEQIGVIYHVPKQPVRVPYSLNLRQFPDGRVLMTSGDEPMAELIAGIIGEDMLYLTEVPIQFFPAFRLAGIRCLTGLLPEVFFRKA